MNDILKRVDAEARDLLGEAHDYIQANGLHKGSLRSYENESVCTLGALSKAHIRRLAEQMRESPPSGTSVLKYQQAVIAKAIVRVQREVEREAGCYMRISDWNDAAERTAEDVLLVLKKASA